MKLKLKSYLPIILTSLMGIIIFPTAIKGVKFPDFGFLAWIFLVPLIYRLRDEEGFFKKFRISFLTSFIFYLGSIFWLAPAMTSFASLSIFVSLAMVFGISFILSMFFSFSLSFGLSLSKKVRIPSYLVVAIFLCASDILRSYFPFGGFPWNIPAYSQGEYLSSFQWVDITGVMGVNFLILLVNVLIAEIIISFKEKHKDQLISRLVILFLVFIISIVGNIQKTNQTELAIEDVGLLRVGLVQANIEQSVKWDLFLSRDHLDKHIKLTDEAFIKGARVVFWPESSYPYTFDLSMMDDDRIIPRGKMPIPVLAGLISQTSGEDLADIKVYNSVALLDSNTIVRDIYHKRNLVPFGEYIPDNPIFSFIETLTVQDGDFSKGRDPVVFDMQDVQVGNLICYEDLFPELSRQSVLKGANLIANYTNDGWFNRSSGPYQHIVFSQYRALENRRYLVRATNTGLTGVINWRGEVENLLTPDKKGFLIHDVKIIEFQSFYTKYGPIFSYLILSGFGIILIMRFIKNILDKFRTN
jgi:apolipoprotein N-acyltransferase